MKVAVMGAGAVGCYYGGMLARAGHEVVLIGRPQHVQAVSRDGLRMETKTFDERVRLAASTEAAAAAGADLVLFCVKSTDTAEAGAQLRGLLAPGALVLSLQNGVDNAERLRDALGLRQGESADAEAVAAGVVYVATEMAGPGHVKHHGRGDLVIEPTPASERVAQALAAAGVPTVVSPNVRGELWAKLIINCAYNALSAIARLPYGQLVQGEGIRETQRTVVDEALAVARADGVTVEGDMHAAVEKIAQAMATQYSSTAQDLMRGKRSEIDHLNGYVLARGAALGVPTPVNRVLHALVKLLEQRAGKV